jgi:hypothetical protein
VDDIGIVPFPAKDDFSMRLEISCCKCAEREGTRRAEDRVKDGVGSAAIPKVVRAVTSLAGINGEVKGLLVSATSLVWESHDINPQVSSPGIVEGPGHSTP